MNSNLLVDLSIGQDLVLYVTDHTDYIHWNDELSEHVFLEFLTDKDENILLHRFSEVSLSQFIGGCHLTSSFSLPSDGEIYYYKLVIPKLEHYKNSEDLTGRYFYYKGRIFESTVSKDNEITDLFKLFEDRESQGFFWASKKIFSISKLEKCLLNLQRRIIENCYVNKCTANEDLKVKRDFILSSVFVLRFLIASHKYNEAQRILDNLSMCGANICDDENSLTNKDCGCGHFN